MSSIEFPTDEILAFWFEELSPSDWFGGGERVDELIRARFADLQAALAKTPPEPGELTGPDHLAAVLVVDQFSRNLFRGSAQAFATDARARALANDAISRGLDRSLDAHRRQFLYMPFMHSEDRVDQARSVELFEALGDPEVLDFARQHQVIVDRFGRFPHRNAALGRASTPDELEFLRTSPGFS